MSNVPTRTDATERPVKGSLRYRSLAWLLLTASFGLAAPACSRSTPAQAPEVRAGASEQAIVERSAAAYDRMRHEPRFARMDAYLERARAVMIFPRLVKASLIFGGEGGNGVLVVRQADGAWSAPAFYSLGSPSVGFQIGYQQATVVLFVMDEATLERALHSSVALGAKAGITLSGIDQDPATAADVISANIYQAVDAEGVFAGASLDGYVIAARSRHNLAYYGKPVSPRDILMDGVVYRPESSVLARVLAPRAEDKQAAVFLR